MNLNTPPTPGIMAAMRKLTESAPSNVREAHRVLQRLWPRVDVGVTEEAWARYSAETEVSPEASPHATITVTPIGAGRVPEVAPEVEHEA
jgi:hypothetical protein